MMKKDEETKKFKFRLVYILNGIFGVGLFIKCFYR